jgi:hypothetical protein
MHRNVTSTCPQHEDRFDCPDALLHYSAPFDEYGIIVHDGGTSYVVIGFCPWCGAKLPESKADKWFEELEELGYDNPLFDESSIPEKYNSDAWWRDG